MIKGIEGTTLATRLGIDRLLYPITPFIGYETGPVVKP